MRACQQSTSRPCAIHHTISPGDKYQCFAMARGYQELYNDSDGPKEAYFGFAHTWIDAYEAAIERCDQDYPRCRVKLEADASCNGESSDPEPSYAAFFYSQEEHRWGFAHGRPTKNHALSDAWLECGLQSCILEYEMVPLDLNPCFGFAVDEETIVWAWGQSMEAVETALQDECAASDMSACDSAFSRKEYYCNRI